MTKYLLVAAAAVALALAPAAFAQTADMSGNMGHDPAMAHGCKAGKDAIGHPCKADAMRHDTMGHDAMAHEMGHDAMGHATSAN